MRHILILVTFLIFPNLPAFAELRLAKAEISLGEIRGGAVHPFTVAVRNSGSEPLDLLHIEKTCGCLTAGLDKNPIAPGAEVQVPFEVRPLGQPDGPHTWFVKLHYREGNSAAFASFPIRAIIRNEVTVQPTVLAFFGSGSLQQHITIHDRRGTLKVLQVAAPDFVTATPVAGPNGTTKIVVATPATIPAGRHDGVLYIVTNDPVYDQFRIPIVVSRTEAPAVTWTPETIRIGAETTSVLVRFRSPKGDKVTIERIDSKLDAISTTWASAEDSATVRVRIDRSKMPAGTLASGITIHLTEPTRGTVVVPIVNDE